MIYPLQSLLTLFSLFLAVVALVHIGVNRSAGWFLLGGLGLLELGLVAQCVIGLVQVVRDAPDISTATFLGYLVGVLAIVPAAVLWSLGEKTRAATGVLLLATLVVPFLILRLEIIWSMRVG